MYPSSLIYCSILYSRRTVLLSCPCICVEQVQQMIIQRKPHMGIVISDHNYHALLQIADEMLLLSDRYVYLVRERSDLVRYGYCKEI